MGRPFSGDEEQEIARLFAIGSSVEQIADATGRTSTSIGTHLTRLGLVGRKGLSHGVRDRVLERIASGWRPSRIARQHGMRVEVVERIVVEAVAAADERLRREDNAGRARSAEAEWQRLRAAAALAREIVAQRRAERRAA